MFNLHFRYTYSRQREQREHREIEREKHDMRRVSALFFLTKFATQLFIINTKLVQIKLELWCNVDGIVPKKLIQLKLAL